jgi:hypothetical protein
MEMADTRRDTTSDNLEKMYKDLSHAPYSALESQVRIMRKKLKGEDNEDKDKLSENQSM